MYLSECRTELVRPHALQLAQSSFGLGRCHVGHWLLRLGSCTTPNTRRSSGGFIGGHDRSDIRRFRGQVDRLVVRVRVVRGFVSAGRIVAHVLGCLGRRIGGRPRVLTPGRLGVMPLGDIDLVILTLVERIRSSCGSTQPDRRRLAQHRQGRRAIRLALQLLRRTFARTAAALHLHGVCNFVSDQPLAARRIRLISTCAEVNLTILHHGAEAPAPPGVSPPGSRIPKSPEPPAVIPGAPRRRVNEERTGYSLRRVLALSQTSTPDETTDGIFVAALKAHRATTNR